MQTVRGCTGLAPRPVTDSLDVSASEFLDACEQGDLELLKLCASSCSSLPFTRQDKQGRQLNALQLASLHGQLEVVEWLCENTSLDMNHTTGDGSQHSALSLALESDGAEVVDYLVAKGAKAGCDDHERVLAFYQAVKDGDLVAVEEWLKKEGAFLKGGVLAEGSLLLAEGSLKEEPLRHYPRILGTALDFACQNRYQALITTLVDAMTNHFSSIRPGQGFDVGAAFQNLQNRLVKNLLCRPRTPEAEECFYARINQKLLRIEGHSDAEIKKLPVSPLLADIKKCKSPLHQAALHGDSFLVSKLLYLAAIPEELNEQGFTSMHFAILGENLDVLSTLNTLTDHNSVNYEDMSIPPLLHMAAGCNPGALKVLLDASPNTKEQYFGNLTALDFACKCDQPQSVEMLLKIGFDPLKSAPDGKTALERAVSGNRIAAVEYMLAYAEDSLEPHERKVLRSRLVASAGMNEHWLLVDRLLARGDIYTEVTRQTIGTGQTSLPLRLFMSRRRGAIIFELLIDKYYQMGPGSANAPVIDYILKKPDSDIAKLLRQDFIQILVKGGVDLLNLFIKTPLREKLLNELQEHAGFSALHYAVMNPDIAVVDAVLDAGASLAITSQKRQLTPLSIAIENNKYAAAECLLWDCSKDVCDAGDSVQRTALHHAVTRSLPLTYMLLLKGSNPLAANTYQTAPMDLVDESDRKWVLLDEAVATYRRLQFFKTEQDLKIPAGLIQLHHKLCKGACSKDIAEQLRREDCQDVNRCLPNVGMNALHLAASLGQVDNIRTLLQYGAIPDVQTRGNESTALHLAIRSGVPEAVTPLLDFISLHIYRNSRGLVPFELALNLDEKPCQGSALDQIWSKIKVCITPENVESHADSHRRQNALCAFNALHRMVQCHYWQHSLLMLLKDPAARELINVRNRTSGNAALHQAVVSGNVDAVKTLVDSGANINLRNSKDGMTPLHLAIALDRPDMLRELLKLLSGEELSDALTVMRDNNGNTVSDLAQKSEDTIFKTIIDASGSL